MLLSQVISFAALKKEGYSSEQIKKMLVSFALFPTPFKGIYYVPFFEEKKARTLNDSARVLTMAIEVFLGTDKFYYTCRTAEEFHGIEWHPSGLIHVANEKLSKKINLEKRVERKQGKKTYYSQTSAAILEQYGKIIQFHRCNMAGAKFKQTTAGMFATKAQIRIDKKRFRN